MRDYINAAPLTGVTYVFNTGDDASAAIMLLRSNGATIYCLHNDAINANSVFSASQIRHVATEMNVSIYGLERTLRNIRNLGHGPRVGMTQWIYVDYDDEKKAIARSIGFITVDPRAVLNTDIYLGNRGPYLLLGTRR